MEFLQTVLRRGVNPSRKPKAKADDAELNRKAGGRKMTKKKVQFESEPLDRSKDVSGIRVKILMRREEAARLLSKCKNGGILEFGDLASELDRTPSYRVGVVSATNKEN